MRTENGWIGRAHAEVMEEHQRRRTEEHEERERHARRRIRIEPSQPQPAGMTSLDRTLDDLLGGR